MPRATDALEASRGTPRQADQDRQVGIPNVDAEFQARTGDDRPEVPRLERGLDRAATVGVERRVMGGNVKG